MDVFLILSYLALKRTTNPQKSKFTYLIEHFNLLDEDFQDSLWDVRYTLSSNPNIRHMPVCNRPLGIVSDPFIQDGGDIAAYDYFPAGGDEVGYSDLLGASKTISTWSVVAGSSAPDTDGLGAKCSEICCDRSRTATTIFPAYNV